jgi:membrane protein DedA with SNARE-associated domain
MDAFLFFILKTPGFTHFISRFGYIGIVVWFITFDQLTPLPEEISLLVMGYLCVHSVFNPVLAGISSLVGFLIIDSIYFVLSKKGSSYIKKKTKGSSSFMESYREKLKHHTFKAVFILCFIPRMRLFAPILAGSTGMSFKKFLWFDVVALTAFTTVYLLLGMIFNKTLGAAITKTKGLQNIIFFAAVALIAVTLVFLIRKRTTNKNREKGEDTEIAER